MRNVVVAAIIVVVACHSIYAETETESEARAEILKQHPHAMFYGAQYFDGEGFFEEVGTADTVYGTVLSTGGSPLDSAWGYYQDIEGLYVDVIGELVPATQASGEVLQGVMWDGSQQSHGFYTFRFNQTLGGVPVFRSGIGFLVRNEAQFPLVMASSNFKELAGFEVNAANVGQPIVNELMLKNVSRLMDSAPVFQGAGPRQNSVLGEEDDDRKLKTAVPVAVAGEQLVIWAGVSNVRTAPELAIVFKAQRGRATDLENFAKHLVVAAVDDGEILYSENLVLADVNGTVSGQATEGVTALECGPVATVPLPYASVQELGGESVFADAAGAFVVPGSSGPVTLRSRLQGRYFQVLDDTIGATPFIDIDLTAPGSIDFLHNPDVISEFATSNVNSYLHANIVRDFVLNFEPTFPVIANQTGFLITTNNDSLFGVTSCNAFYTGDAINFMRNAGACNNTSMPDVVYHEYGHHLIAMTGNGQGQLGEGASDTMGVLIQDNPEESESWFESSCDSFLRSAENFRTFPCNGPIHDCGQLISGCIWDTINQIRSVDPDNALEITGRLFVGMLIVRGQMVPGNSQINPLITAIMLELDDDDDSILNGTPHSLSILAAFGQHNMIPEGFDASLDITTPNGIPVEISPSGGTSFEVDVASDGSEPLIGSGVLHVDRGNGFEQFPMVQNDSNSYTAVFPPIECLVTARFFISVAAENGAPVFLPTDAPAEYFSAISLTKSSIPFQDSFDSDQGWLVTGDATGGQWERAVPGSGSSGAPESDFEDFGLGFCYLTDSATNSNVDGGNTILTTPVFDGTSTGESFVTYHRWFSNISGGVIFEDIFVIEISNDGGDSWSNLETLGPTGPSTLGGWRTVSHRIEDFVEATDNMRVRFIASDMGGETIVEAGVDGFEVQRFDCADAILLGDINLDGTVDLLDIAPFVDLLINGEFLAEADVNQDGAVDLSDIAPFVALLTG